MVKKMKRLGNSRSLARGLKYSGRKIGGRVPVYLSPGCRQGFERVHLPLPDQKGVLVGRKKKRKVNPWNPLPPYAQIEEKLIRSKGFEELNITAKWLFIEFRLRYKGDNPRNIIFLGSEAERIMNKRTFRKGCKDLIKLGFLDLVRRGGFYKIPHIYGLSNRWRSYGSNKFIEVDIDKLFPEMIEKK